MINGQTPLNLHDYTLTVSLHSDWRSICILHCSLENSQRAVFAFLAALLSIIPVQCARYFLFYILKTILAGLDDSCYGWEGFMDGHDLVQLSGQRHGAMI
jgi:hypothetical protein